ncbi:MAG: DUF4358 domain-containing protein [Oscillospiraceae bacterium]|nr:DUF4358 domain-containing protein [Oscillospiraceae bacterium]
MKTCVKRIACLALAALLLGSGLGCASQPEDNGPDVDMSALMDAMLAADKTLPELTIVTSHGGGQAETDFTYLSDLDYKLVDEYFYACAQAGTAEEIAVVKLKDAGQAAAMMDSLHKHIEARQGTFREYDPGQVPLTEDAVIIREGRYVALIVCEKNGLVQNVFRDSFQES